MIVGGEIRVNGEWRRRSSEDMSSYLEADARPLEDFKPRNDVTSQHFNWVTMNAVLRIDCKSRSGDHLGGYCNNLGKRR